MLLKIVKRKQIFEEDYMQDCYKVRKIKKIQEKHKKKDNIQESQKKRKFLKKEQGKTGNLTCSL